MSRNVDFNCCISGTGRIFTVEIQDSNDVSALKDAIKEKEQCTFQSIDASTLDLWLVRRITVGGHHLTLPLILLGLHACCRAYHHTSTV